MSDILKNTVAWFHAATPNPTQQNISTQMGCHFEEVKEMVDCLTPRTKEAQVILQQAQAALDNLAGLMKRDATAIGLHPSDYVDFVDSLGDQIVTATGSGTYLGMDVPGALDEINKSNHSKFVDGKPVRDPDSQKILKGPDYFKANLKPFVPQ